VQPRAAAGVQRISFVIQADHLGDVLARVVVLFHRLNVDLEALYMVRRQKCGDDAVVSHG
jgi:hypothetical protein